jgi:secreted trypsin-like serine protease
MRIAAALAVGAAAVLAQPAMAESGNWMRDYVQLRQRAMAARYLGQEAAEELARAQSRIVGGVVAAPNSNKFQVGLLHKSISDNFQAQYCGGTLIKPNIVVTAAHCSDFVTAGQVQVLTGARRLANTGANIGVRRNVTKITVHPGWTPSTNNNDVAVWELATNAPGPFATLATADPPVNTLLLATGWGALTEGGAFPINLMQVKLPHASRANCNDANSYNGTITNRMLCAGFNAGGKDTCQGDSGGPLTRDPPGAPVNYSQLVGVTSFGVGCARPNKFGVYTRVSNAAIRNFILAND